MSLEAHYNRTLVKRLLCTIHSHRFFITKVGNVVCYSTANIQTINDNQSSISI